MKLGVIVLLFVLCWSTLQASELTNVPLANQALLLLDEATDGKNQVMNDLYGSSLTVHGYNIATINPKLKVHTIAVKSNLVNNHFACAQIKSILGAPLTIVEATRFESLAPALQKCGFPPLSLPASTPDTVSAGQAVPPTSDKLGNSVVVPSSVPSTPIKPALTFP